MYSFPMGENETILKKGHASLHFEENAFHGALYLTNERVVYVGYVMDITRKYVEAIPLARVAEVTGGKTFYVIANVLLLTTIGGEQYKFIVDAGQLKGWLAAINAQTEAARA